MQRLIFCFLISAWFSSTCAATTHAVTPPKKISHVIYITLDGTRWQDVFSNPSIFKKLWEKHAHKGIFYGAPDSNTSMQVASVPVSLPSYQSQMAGAVQLCVNNNCGRIRVETLPENLIAKLKLTKKDVAIFASWPQIDLAVEHKIGVTFSNSGVVPVYDPITGQADEVMRELNESQAAEQGEDAYRFDQYTFAQALHYFEKYQPLFLWIALCDADNAAHANDLNKYHQILAFYDEVIDNLLSTLQKLGIEQETLMIITTDHGRGNGDRWTDHGPSYPESKQTWAFVVNGELQQRGETGDVRHFNTLSIRPTVEKALGLLG